MKNPVGRNRIGPLKREDGSLAVNYQKERGLANIAGTRLGRANINFVQQSDHTGCSYPSVSDKLV